MAFERSNTNGQSLWRLLLALLCIVLVLASGTIQAVHSHPDGDVSHADCSLCATAHVAVQVASPVVSVSFSPLVSRVEVVSKPPAVRSQTTFALFTRPPPVDAVSA